jgi:alpha-tubulin suppressor-like RCC1 family protein
MGVGIVGRRFSMTISMRRGASFHLLLAALVSAGCGAADPEGFFDGEAEGGQAENVATVTAALAVVPSDVTCVSFTLSGTTTGTQRFSVTPNATSVKLSLGQLPIGVVSIAPAAHNIACGSVTGSSVATWVGATVNVNVVPGMVTEIPINLLQNVPVGATVDFVGVAQSIGLGYYANYAVLTDGTVRSWGQNTNGQLGTGTSNSGRVLPGPVINLTGITKVAAGGVHACALNTTGQVFCWGAGYWGQLGNNSTFGTSIPTQVVGPELYRDLGAGEYDTCAAETTGRFKCWGDNSRGQLADFTHTNRLVPSSAPNLGAGQYDLLVVGERTTFAFGGNESACDGAAIDGQLGDGTTAENPGTGRSGCHVNGGARFVLAGDAGPYHSCVVEASFGNVYCSGHNGSGQLGNGTTTSTTLPVQVPGLSNMTAVATGWNHTCALRNDGMVYCWGNNTYGQLGDGTGTARLLPVQVPGFWGVKQLGAATSHTCALKTDGSMWCWGNNDYGQLGNGNMSNRATPTRVLL